jgi:glycosyltransferase involved in cell wall biosynthesis
MSSVDVIVPCYRYAHFLKQCVTSVLTQTGPTVRVLIIDDASPDDTPAVAHELSESDSRVEFVRHAVNKGHIATYNEGIDWTAGDYMLLLSADDFLLSGSLAAAVQLMDAHPDVGFTFGRALEVDEHGTFRNSHTLSSQSGRWSILEGMAFIRKSGAHNIVPTPTAVVRTDLQKRVGGYRAELPHSGDMEMWLRLAAHARVGRVARYQAAVRRHAANMSLSYDQEGSIPDLRQKKAAIDLFSDSCPLLESSAHLREHLYRALAHMAVGRASAAINDQDEVLSKRLSDYAVEVWPAVTESWPWFKLSAKRKMPILWRALSPAIRLVRSHRR